MQMIGDLDELSYDYEEDGVLVRKQLDRVILARGAWATVMFFFQELDRATGAYRGPKIAIVRLQKWRGGYRKQSSFTLSNEAQARQMAEVVGGWCGKMTEMRELGASDDDDGGDEFVGAGA